MSNRPLASPHRRADGRTGGAPRPPGVPRKKPPTAGGFKKGYDPRRVGNTPEEVWHLQREAVRLAPLALATIETLIKDDATPPTTRLMACESILNRGFGRAPQSMTLTLDTKPRDIRTLSNEELMQLAQGLTIEGLVVDTSDVQMPSWVNTEPTTASGSQRLPFLNPDGQEATTEPV